MTSLLKSTNRSHALALHSGTRRHLNFKIFQPYENHLVEWQLRPGRTWELEKVRSVQWSWIFHHFETTRNGALRLLDNSTCAPVCPKLLDICWTAYFLGRRSLPIYQRPPLSVVHTFFRFWPLAQTVHTIKILLSSTNPNSNGVDRREVKKIESHFVVSKIHWKFFRPFVSIKPQLSATTEGNGARVSHALYFHHELRSRVFKYLSSHWGALHDSRGILKMNHTHIIAVDAPALGIRLPIQRHPRSGACKRFLLRLLAQLIFMHAYVSYHPFLPEHSEGRTRSQCSATLLFWLLLIVVPSKVTTF